MFWRRKEKKVELADEPILQESNVQESIEAPEQDSTPEPEPEQEPPKKKGLFAKLRDSLRATRESIVQKTLNLFNLRGKIDDDLLDELEEMLISADVGYETSMELIGELRNRIRREKKADSTDIDWLTNTLQELASEMIAWGERDLKLSDSPPSIYLVIGVNGVGKTTAIGKLAHRIKGEGKNVLLVAADTFRAAAVNQLKVWSERADVDIVLGKEGADPSSVVYQAVAKAKETNPDCVIIDTAGRLHTKVNLMHELSKMAKVIEREFPGAPHETLLVLDASTGQNALMQAKTFMESCPITGLILTKLDGTAKGGVVMAVHKQLKLPVKFIGVGEGIEDLEPFNADAFTKALFAINDEKDE